MQPPPPGGLCEASISGSAECAAELVYDEGIKFVVGPLIGHEAPMIGGQTPSFSDVRVEVTSETEDTAEVTSAAHVTVSVGGEVLAELDQPAYFSSVKSGGDWLNSGWELPTP